MRVLITNKFDDCLTIRYLMFEYDDVVLMLFDTFVRLNHKSRIVLLKESKICSGRDPL